MNPRRDPRFARRLPVRFWRSGRDEPFSGYTTNLSRAGMFVATTNPLKPGVRARIEILDDRHGFMVEGLVVHAARVSPLLKKLGDSGMGLRFLDIDELISPIVPMSSPKVDTEGAEAAEGEAAVGRAAGEKAPDASPDDPPAGTLDEPSVGEPAADLAGTSRPADVSPIAPLFDAPESPPELTYPLRFATLPAFLRILKQDIEKGGIFIATAKPAKLHQWITVEIRIPAPIAEIVRLPARVVHRVERDDSTLLAGMGVQLADTVAAVERIHKLLYEAKEPPAEPGGEP